MSVSVCECVCVCVCVWMYDRVCVLDCAFSGHHLVSWRGYWVFIYLCSSPIVTH